MTDETYIRILPEHLREKYELLNCIKRGEDNASYLAYDRFLQRKVFVKYGSLHALENEARILAALSCQSVPRVYGIYQVGEKAFLFQEYIEGRNLRSYIEDHGPLDEKTAINLGMQLCSVLTALWSCDPPIVHRDVKLDNIVLAPGGRIYLVDFGISREYNESVARDTDVQGTPETAAPEQFGFCQTDHRSDIYALGVVLTELLTGQSSLPEEGVSPGLRKIIEKCTDFSPNRRYSTAESLNKDLTRYAGRSKRRIRSLMFAAAVALCFAGFLWAGANRVSTAVQEHTYYTFFDPAIEAETARLLGKKSGEITPQDLEAITEIHLVGNQSASQFSDIHIQGKWISINGEPVAELGMVQRLDDLANMPNLTALSLCNQQIQDISPLAGLNLRQLNLHGNSIRSVGPLEKCQRLEELYLSDNPIADLLPLSNLDRLWRLDVSVTNVATLEAMIPMETLQDLRIRACPQLDDFSALSQLTNLNQLFISPTTDEAAETICSMENLTGLYIWHNSSITSMKQLSSLTKLIYLFFDYSSIADLEGIESLHALQELTLRNSAVTDLTPLKASQNLTRLNICGTYAEDYSILSDLKQLRQVSCFNSQQEAVEQALKEHPDVSLQVFSD